MPAWTLNPADGTLCAAGRPVLQLAPGWSTTDDASGAGIFLRPPATEPAPYLELPLGRIAAMRRFTSLFRFSPFWTRPAIGSTEAEVRPETLWLLAQTGPGHFTMLVPLLDERSRYALRASPDGLVLTAETGDPALACRGGVALFVATGDDPYALVAAGARAVQRQLGIRRLRQDKPLPDVVNLFGWCTWDAFYKDVSAEGVLAGLASFARAGVPPRWLIVDDGWQQWQRADSGEDRLVSLDPNARFGGSLAPLVQRAKAEFGVQRVLVWHALLGYWGGLDAQAFPGLGVRSVARSFGPGLLEQEPRWNVQPWGAQLGVPAADQLARFYDGWHARLAAQGVDGVKVDAQALLEAVCAGQGGRIALARVVRRALEDSVHRHFDGRLINCMSCGSEGAYLDADSTLMRSSDDFFPQRPASHGLHLQVNALAGLWFGEFMQPDWDMFHSAHPQAAFHAAARAISGGPVYVSDKVGAHDAALLRKLVLSDGSVLRADLPARPSPDCLFADPTQQPVLLKIFNHNRDCGVVGLFNAGQGEAAIAGTVTPQDLPGFAAAGDCVAWAHRHDRLWHGASTPPAATFALAAGEWELVSFAPVEHGFAAIGLADKFNSSGAITTRAWTAGGCEIGLRDGGRFLAWSARPPVELRCDGAALPFTHDATTGRLQADIAPGGARRLRLRWADRQ